MHPISITRYRPRFASFPHLVISFFQKNQEEELTVDDMAAKWDGLKRNSVHTILSTAVEQQILLRERTEDGEYIYKAGPEIEAADICTLAEPSQAGAPSAQGIQHNFHVDIGVPVPNARSQPRNGKWSALLSALTLKGQSIAIAEKDFKKIKATVQKIKQKQKGEPPHYYVGQDDQGTHRIWRTA